jgi:hypothetical protein
MLPLTNVCAGQRVFLEVSVQMKYTLPPLLYVKKINLFRESVIEQISR